MIRWSQDLKVFEHELIIPEPGHRYRVTEVFVVDPKNAGDEGVTVSIKAGGHEVVLGPISAYNPDTNLRSVLALDEDFWLHRCHDSADETVVRFKGYVLTIPGVDDDPMPAEPIDVLVQLQGGASESEDDEGCLDDDDREEGNERHGQVDVPPPNIRREAARASGSPPLRTHVRPGVAATRAAAGRSPTSQGAGVVSPPVTERSFSRRPYFYG